MNTAFNWSGDKTQKALAAEARVDRNVEYERRKANWIAANPASSPREYSAAMTRIAREVGV